MSRAKRQIKPPQYLNEYELEEHSQKIGIDDKPEEKKIKIHDVKPKVIRGGDMLSGHEKVNMSVKT